MPSPPDGPDILGRRIVAALLDLLAVLALMILVGLAFGDTYAHGGSVGVSLTGASAAIWLLATLAYFLGLETLGGQTLGKRVLGIRVVALDGSSASAPRVAVRTLMRAMDFLPFLYLIGFLAALATGRRRQRLGDLVAGTTVVSASRG